jgi:hypothetical protein
VYFVQLVIVIDVSEMEPIMTRSLVARQLDILQRLEPACIAVFFISPDPTSEDWYMPTQFYPLDHAWTSNILDTAPRIPVELSKMSTQSSTLDNCVDNGHFNGQF